MRLGLQLSGHETKREERAGFEKGGICLKKEKFKVTGMSCSACSSRVEKTVSKLEGTEDVSVNLLTGSMQVKYDEDVLSEADIISAVEHAGYGAFAEAGQPGAYGNDESVTGGWACGSAGGGQPDMAGGQHGGGSACAGVCGSLAGFAGDSMAGRGAAYGGMASQGALDDTKRMKKRLVWSLVFWLPFMAVSMGPMVTGNHHNMENPLTMILIQILLLIPIVFLNRKYFVKGIPALFRGGANMDSLIAVGSGAAIIYGVFALFRIVHGYETGDMTLVHKYSSDIYFESAATILTLITVGKYLETKSKGKTSQAIEKLMDLAPKTATVEIDGVEQVVPVAALKEGDIIVVRPGESFAADGEIISGSGGIDESAITGESIPAEKQVGDKVISATVNKTGFIKVRCEKVGADSTISQIINLVEEAGASKAPIAKLADRIAGIFVPTVMTIALVTVIVWLILGARFEFALSAGIAVLVISCPCALGLATPVAIMVGTGKGAENGILIKSGEAFETASKVDTVVMDKTGTVTKGCPEVTDVKALGISEEELLQIAAGLEKGSEHPLAEAVCRYAEEQNIRAKEFSDFSALFGKGIQGQLDGVCYCGGNAALMAEKNVDISNLTEILDGFANQGKTPMIFAKGMDVIGIIAVADVEKETSAAAIKAFEKMGIDVIMLTGDNRKTAEAIRKKLDIPKVIAEVFPADKEKHIAKLQAEGHKVAMIGDGINDAPALARADVGIAIGAGTDIAIESADAVLMRNDLMDAAACVRLSKSVIRNIKENLFWAFFYNIIGIPVAAGVLYPAFGLKLSPMFAAAAMSLSSVCVVTNALRLRFFKTDRRAAGSGTDESVAGGETEIPEAGGGNGKPKTGDGTENVAAGSCCEMPAGTENPKPEDNKTDKQEEKTMKYELKIEGMMCQHCQKHAHDALAKMDGVTGVEVNLEEKSAVVEADREITTDEFAEVIKEAGYELVK